MKKREVGAEARGGGLASSEAAAAIAHARPGGGEPTHGERMSPPEMEAAASRGVRAAGESASWDGEPQIAGAYRDIDYDPPGHAMTWGKAGHEEPGSEHARVVRRAPQADSDIDLLGAHGYREQQNENPAVFGRPPELADPDEALREAVLTRVGQVSGVDLQNLEVRVRGGEITLRGVVDRVGVRDAVAAAVGEVAGVVRVENDLRISRELDIFSRRAGSH